MKQKQHVMSGQDFYVIMFTGSSNSEALAVEFDLNNKKIILPLYRLN